jgi:hypothetical protein
MPGMTLSRMQLHVIIIIIIIMLPIKP